jgi:hypothetical protein
LATAGLLADADPAKASPKAGEKTDPARPERTRMAGKIALEEHFATPETNEASTAATHSPEFRRQILDQILDMGSGRIAEMDRGGVELCILSLVNSGDSVHSQNSAGDRPGAAIERLSGRANRKISQAPEGVRGVTLAGSSSRCRRIDALRQSTGLLRRVGARIFADQRRRWGRFL